MLLAIPAFAATDAGVTVTIDNLYVFNCAEDQTLAYAPTAYDEDGYTFNDDQYVEYDVYTNYAVSVTFAWEADGDWGDLVFTQPDDVDYTAGPYPGEKAYPAVTGGWTVPADVYTGTLTVTFVP